MKNFADRLIDAIIKKQSYLCVGLDPQPRYIPPHILKYCAKRYGPGLKATAEAIIMFNRAIIDATIPFAACDKPQMAFYEKYGSEGVRAFEETVAYLRVLGQITIEDAKREDGGDTSTAYAEGHLGHIDVIGENGDLVKATSPINVDAITITPWIDSPNFDPFKKEVIAHGKGAFVVDKTSFKPASRFQMAETKDGKKMWELLTEAVSELCEGTFGERGYSSIGTVMGATYPEEAQRMKELLPKSFKLIPGYGAGQKGKADDAVVCINKDGFGGIVNNSRGTNYAWHPKFGGDGDGHSFALAAAESARTSRDELNEAVRRSIGKLPWE